MDAVNVVRRERARADAEWMRQVSGIVSLSVLLHTNETTQCM